MRRLGLLFLTILTGDHGDQTQRTGFRKRRQSLGPFKRWQIQRQQAAHEDPLTAAQKAGNDAPTGTGRVSPVEKTLGSAKKTGASDVPKLLACQMARGKATTGQ